MIILAKFGGAYAYSSSLEPSWVNLLLPGILTSTKFEGKIRVNGGVSNLSIKRHLMCSNLTHHFIQYPDIHTVDILLMENPEV